LHVLAQQIGFSGDLKAFRRHYKANREKTVREAVQVSEQQMRDYLLRQFLPDFSKTYAVLCLTAARDSNLMWAHYASGHTGIALGIAIPSNWKVYNVEYRKDRMAIELTGSPDEGPRFDFSLALLRRKGEDWAYEHEWRALSQLKHLEQVTIGGKTLYFAPLKPELIKEVILGWRFPSEFIADIKRICTENFPTAQLLKAAPHETEFKMAIGNFQDEELNAASSALTIPPQDFSGASPRYP
jgi:hypothetical protein